MVAHPLVLQRRDLQNLAEIGVEVDWPRSIHDSCAGSSAKVAEIEASGF
jgi:hypothetical protein